MKWFTSLDERVRSTHMDAHGQVVAADEAFTVGGEQLEWPGDPKGSSENVINCRCTAIPVVE